MSDEQQFSDEELTGFLDGELDHHQSQLITRQLAGDVQLNQRLAALDIDKAQLRSSFDMLVAAAPTMPQLDRAQAADTNSTPFNSLRIFQSRLAVACFLFVGAVSLMLAYSLGTFNARAGWTHYVAAYHKLYITQTLSSVDDEVEIQKSQLGKTSAALGMNIPLAAMTGSKELHYKRSQILGYGGQAIAQMTFLTPLGAPVALCIIRRSDKTAENPKFDEMEKMAAAVWSSSGYEFLLIGGEDRSMIERNAKYFAANL